MKRAVLLVSPEPWDAHWVSKHHYARVLAASGRIVLFLDPPDQEFEGIELVETEVKNVTRVRMPRLRRGLRFYPQLLRRRLETIWLNALEERCGFRIDLIWLFENSRFFDMSFAGDRLKIYHQVDLNQNFNLALAASTADICFCTTDLIQTRISKHNELTFKVHHATALVEPHVDTQPPSQPVVTYIGNLDMQYLDLDVLGRLIEAYPNLTFELVGGFSEANPLRKKHATTPNVRWTGKVKHTKIPDILAESSVLLVAYLREYEEDQASPHKVMEYLLSGRVIVASYMDEYEDKPGLVEMAQPDGDIAPVFERVLADLGTYNAPERQSARRAFALDHTYERQLERIEKLVEAETGRKL